jgi:dihydrofolate synthase/folylpolyglutamate synthase
VGTVALLSEKGFRLENNAIYQGLKDTHWEGRLEILQKRPVVLIDAAHNPAGIGALCDTLKTQFSYRRLIVIFGVLNDKDYKNMLKKMAPLVQHLIITRPDSSRSLSPEKIFMIAQQYPCDTVIVEKPDEALHQALVEAGPDDLICITGSVYLIGEIKKVYQKVYREK